MTLPAGEHHSPDKWILKEKRRIHGRGFLDQPVETNYANFECEDCDNTYVRLVDEEEFIELRVDDSNWKWGWFRIK